MSASSATTARLPHGRTFRRVGLLPRAGLAIVGALLAAWRLHEAQAGLLYPDGYQYLLMAKGLAAHGRPWLALDDGGDVLLPNADAALKPLYPALVALAHGVGLDWFAAARLVTAIASAAGAVLAGLLVLRLTGSRAGALAASGVLVASPTAGYWYGFAGPDALAGALGLGAVLAFVCRRPQLGGALAGLAVAARPELLLLGLAAALVAVWSSPLARRHVAAAAATGLLVAGTLFALAGPPLELPPLLALAGLGLAPVAALALRPVSHGGSPASWRFVAAGAASALVAAFMRGRPALEAWAANDWPLLVVGGAGLIVALVATRTRTAAFATLIAALVLGSAYWAKNPTSERYAALLVPLLAVACGLGVAAVRSRGVALTAAALAACAAWALPAPAPATTDALGGAAARVAARTPANVPLVTAAPDAYGVLLARPIRVLRPGATGIVVLDGVQRAYAPDLTATGRVVARIGAGAGFRRPDGTIDRRPIVLVRGRVVEAPR
jgi:hypothetical protein